MLTPLASTRRLFGDKMTSEPADGSTSPSRKPPKLWPDAAAGKVGSVKVCLPQAFSKSCYGLSRIQAPTAYVIQHDGAICSSKLVI